jgi:hypothetical protein
MRRGTSVSSGSEKKRAPVMADIGDLEGGGGIAPALLAPPSGSSPFLTREGLGVGSGRVSSGNMPSQMDIGSYDAGYSSKGKAPRIKSQKPNVVSHAYLTRNSPDSLRYVAVVLFLITACIFPLLPVAWSILLLVASSCCFGAIASLWLSRAVLQCDDGTPEMRAVSDPIREGAEGFLHVQYSAIAKIAGPLALLIVVSYQFRPESADHKGAARLGNTVLGVVAALGFVFGAVCSAVSGYVSMWVAAQSNIRVASASRRTYGEALVVCFRGGAFSAVLNLTLCITGVTSLYTILHFLFVSTWGILEATAIPMLLVGYGFGASFVALFMQLGGGIYTKAADGKCTVLCSFLYFIISLVCVSPLISTVILHY